MYQIWQFMVKPMISRNGTKIPISQMGKVFISVKFCSLTKIGEMLGHKAIRTRGSDWEGRATFGLTDCGLGVSHRQIHEKTRSLTVTGR